MFKKLYGSNLTKVRKEEDMLQFSGTLCNTLMELAFKENGYQLKTLSSQEREMFENETKTLCEKVVKIFLDTLREDEMANKFQLVWLNTWNWMCGRRYESQFVDEPSPTNEDDTKGFWSDIWDWLNGEFDETEKRQLLENNINNALERIETVNTNDLVQIPAAYEMAKLCDGLTHAQMDIVVEELLKLLLKTDDASIFHSTCYAIMAIGNSSVVRTICNMMNSSSLWTGAPTVPSMETTETGEQTDEPKEKLSRSGTVGAFPRLDRVSRP